MLLPDFYHSRAGSERRNLGGRLRKPAVVISHELFGKGVCGMGCTDTTEPLHFDEAVLPTSGEPTPNTCQS